MKHPTPPYTRTMQVCDLISKNAGCRVTPENRGLTLNLPASVQLIADVIGRDRALFLIGKLPKTYPPSTRTAHGATERVILYIPKALKPDHVLVQILGWQDASRLVHAFGGEIMQPANCREIYRRFRDRSILGMLREGQTTTTVAQLMGVSDRHVRNVAKEIPQEERKAGNDNNPGA